MHTTLVKVLDVQLYWTFCDPGTEALYIYIKSHFPYPFIYSSIFTTKDMYSDFSKEYIQVANKYMNR